MAQADFRGLTALQGWQRLAVSFALLRPMMALLMARRFVVAGESMAPTFRPGDYLLIDRLAYWLGTPSRGDAVVLRSPVSSDKAFLKRIVGVPGERVCCDAHGVQINGCPLPEPYATSPAVKPVAESITWVLGEDEYVVLGDNRADSWDSRRFGPVSRRLMEGVAWIRYWPRPRWALLRR